MSWWKRVEEIEQTAAEAGVTLPIPAADIARMEDEGSMYDFVAGKFVDEPEAEAEPKPQRGWFVGWGS